MTRAERIVETLLAKPSLNEGLEARITQYLETLGYRNGVDFHFDGGLRVENPAEVEYITSAINNAGCFGQATSSPMDGLIKIGSFGGPPVGPDDDSLRLAASPAADAIGASSEIDNSCMCDNCGGASHHTDECPYSFGANHQ